MPAVESGKNVEIAETCFYFSMCCSFACFSKCSSWLKTIVGFNAVRSTGGAIKAVFSTSSRHDLWTPRCIHDCATSVSKRRLGNPFGIRSTCQYFPLWPFGERVSIVAPRGRSGNILGHLGSILDHLGSSNPSRNAPPSRSRGRA